MQPRPGKGGGRGGGIDVRDLFGGPQTGRGKVRVVEQPQVREGYAHGNGRGTDGSVYARAAEERRRRNDEAQHREREAQQLMRQQAQRVPRQGAIEAAVREIIDEEARKGQAFVDVGLVVNLLCKRFDVTDTTELGLRDPVRRLQPLQLLEQRVAQVNLLVNAYKKQYTMGSLHDCLGYINRQMWRLTKDSDRPARPDAFADIGIGPFCLHPEIQAHFPGVKGLAAGDPAPLVTMSDLFDAFVEVRQKRRGARMSPADIMGEIVSRRGRSIEELCIFGTDKGMGLMVKIFSDAWQDYNQEYRAFVARNMNDRREEYRARILGAEGREEAMRGLDDELARIAQTADGLVADLHNKVSQLVKLRALDASDVEKRIYMYANKVFQRRTNDFLMAFLKAMAHYLRMSAEYEDLQRYQCAKCNVFYDACSRCFKAPVGSARGLPGVPRREPGEDQDAMEEDEIWDALAGMTLLKNRKEADADAGGVLGRLALLEDELCSMLGVADFDELGHGGFVRFLAAQMAERAADSSDAVAVSLTEFVAADDGARTDAASPADDHPPLRDVLDEALKYLESRKPFLTSWKLLHSIEEEVPKRFGKVHWSGISARPFVHFMMRNTQEFSRRGFNFIHLTKDREGVLLPASLQLLAAFLSRYALVGDVENTESVDAAVQRQFGVKRADDLGHGSARAIAKQVAPQQTEALAAVWRFADVERAVVHELAGEEDMHDIAAVRADVAADPSFITDPLQALLRAAQEPNGVDLASLLLWEDLYEATHGELEAFINANAETLRQEGVQILASKECSGLPRNGMMKYFVVAPAADVASIEAAADGKAYYEMAFNLWSYVVRCSGVIEGRVQEELSEVLLEAFRTARLYNLSGAVCEALLAIPVELTSTIFGEWIAPALERVDPSWMERCHSAVAKHSHKAALLRRALHIGAKSWVVAAPKHFADCPVFGSAGVVVASSTAAAARVGKVAEGAAKGTQTTDEDLEANAAAEKVAPAEHETHEDGEKDMEGDATGEERFLVSVQRSMHIEEGNNISDILKRTLNVIAEQLYESKFHFFFELIQNADDNQYFRQTQPSLYVHLANDHIEVLNNEVGFSQANVNAVCNVNLSTKSNKSASIGRKGIGFKAVFSVTDRPHIVSNGFNFYFDRSSSDIGLIYPHLGGPTAPSVGRLVTLRDVPPSRQTLEAGEWVTRLALPFKRELVHGDGAEQFLRDCSRGLADVQSLVLLFLNKLRKIHVVNLGVERMLTRVDGEETPDDVLREVTITETIGQDSRDERTYLVYGDDVPVPEEVRAHAPSRDADATRMQIGFAKIEDVAEVQTYPVMAYLPTNTKLFSFILQADWTVNAARDRIVESDHWNKFLRESAAGLIVRGLMTLPARIDAGVLPVDYVFGVLPGDECRDNWFRPLFRQTFKELRCHPCVVASDRSWRLPDECLSLPELLRDDIEELFPAGNVLRLLSRYYVHGAVSGYRSVMKNLLVHEFKATTLVELAEGLARDGALEEKPIEWLTKFFGLLREMLRTVQGSHKEALVGRLAKLPLIPIAGGGRLPTAGHEILLTTHAMTSNDHAFFKRLNVVDKDVLAGYETRQLAAVRVLLGELGVRVLGNADKEHILASAKEAVVDGWQAKLADGTVEPNDFSSLVMWIGQTFKHSADALLKEVLAAVPVVCGRVSQTTINALREDQANDDGASVAVPAMLGKRSVLLVLPHDIHVFERADCVRAEYHCKELEWLVLDRELYRGLKLAPQVRDALGVRMGLVGGARTGERVVYAGDAFVTALERRGVEVPKASGSTYMLRLDYEWRALQRTIAHLGEAQLQTWQKAEAFYTILDEVMAWTGVDEPMAEMSYLPDFEGTELEGRVATEDDRILVRVSSTISNVLTESSWVLGTDQKLHAPSDLFFYCNETREYLLDHVAYLVEAPRGAQHGTYQRMAACLRVFGLKGIAQDGSGQLPTAVLAEEVRRWHDIMPFRTSAEHMTAVLKKIVIHGFSKIWMPQDRAWLSKQGSKEKMLEARAKQVPGHWYEPAECFTKGGPVGFLDRARSPYRYVGFVYLRAGYDLMQAGVKEHAPWDVQVAAMESIAEQNCGCIVHIEEHLRNFCDFMDDITEAGWEALRSRQVWFTTSLDFKAASDVTILYNDVGLKVDDQKLPPTHRVLCLKALEQVSPDMLGRYVEFLGKCGIQRLSQVFMEEKQTAEAEYTPRTVAFHQYAWRALFGIVQRLCENMLDSADVKQLGARELFAKTPELSCAFVAKFSVAYMLDGVVVSSSGRAVQAAERGAYYESTSNTIYISTGGDYDAHEVVRAVLGEALQLVGQASNVELQKKLKDDRVEDAFGEVCARAASGHSTAERLLADLEALAARYRDSMPQGTPWVAPRAPADYNVGFGNYGARLHTLRMSDGGNDAVLEAGDSEAGEAPAAKMHAYAWLAIVCAAAAARQVPSENTIVGLQYVVVSDKITVRLTDATSQRELSREDKKSYLCRETNELYLTCPTEPGRLASLVADMVAELSYKLLLWGAADDVVASAAEHVGALQEAAAAATTDVVRGQVAQDAAEVEYYASLLLQRIANGSGGRATLPAPLAVAFEKAKPQRQQATAAAEEPKEKREAVICDPGRGTRWGGQTVHDGNGAPSAGDAAAAREAMKQAEIAKANWPSYKIPDDQHFFATKDFLGPKEGFEYRTGGHGVGYYREDAAGADSDSDSDEVPLPHGDSPGASGRRDVPVDGVVSDNAPAMTVVDGRMDAFRDIEGVSVPQTVLDSLPGGGTHTYLRVDASTRAGEMKLARWGEECMFQQLRQLEAARREADGEYELREIHWLNDEDETKYPFDIILGIPRAVFEGFIDNRGNAGFFSTLQRIVSKYPRFQAVEVKTTRTAHKALLEVGLSEFNAARALRDRYAIYQVWYAQQEPTYKVYYDPYGMTERHELKIVLAVVAAPSAAEEDAFVHEEGAVEEVQE